MGMQALRLMLDDLRAGDVITAFSPIKGTVAGINEGNLVTVDFGDRKADISRCEVTAINHGFKHGDIVIRKAGCKQSFGYVVAAQDVFVWVAWDNTGSPSTEKAIELHRVKLG